MRGARFADDLHRTSIATKNRDAVMRFLICLALLCSPAPAAAQTYLVDFEDALNRCQTFLETPAGFPGDGLERVVKAAPETSADFKDRQFWRFPSSRLRVVDAVRIDRDGQLRSVCNVTLPDNAPPLAPDELDALVLSFARRMERQIAEGTHERRDITQMPPFISLGYGPLKRGIHGCRVTISLSYLPDLSYLPGDHFLWMSSFEQNTPPCEG